VPPSTTSTSPSLTISSACGAPTTSGRCRLRARIALCDSALPPAVTTAMTPLGLQLQQFGRGDRVGDQDFALRHPCTSPSRRCSAACSRPITWSMSSMRLRRYASSMPVKMAAMRSRCRRSA
jgi:hypothetical protein